MLCSNLSKSLLRYLQKVFHMKIFILFPFLYMFGIFFLQSRKFSRKVQVLSNYLMSIGGFGHVIFLSHLLVKNILCFSNISIKKSLI